MHEAASAQVLHLQHGGDRCGGHTDNEPESPLTSISDRRVILASVLLCALCLGYFYVLDRVLFSSAHFSPIFRLLLTGYDARTAWLALSITILAALWTRPAPLRRLAAFLGNHPYSIASLSVAVTAVGAGVVYHGYPLSMDEYAAVFQSKIFATGQLFVQLPRDLIDWLVVRGFNGEFLAVSPETGKAIERYWPGFALLLAPFELLDVPWLCNASLTGVAMILVHRITNEITGGDRRAAGWAILFTAASGVFVADALSYYSMQAHLAANLAFAALLLKPTRARALAAGLVGSLALTLHNPVPHTLFALPWVVAMARDRDQRRWLVPLLLGYLPGVGIGLAWLLFRADIASAADGVSAVSAVADGVFAWPDATMLNMRAAALAKMWLWAVPCLLVFALVGWLLHRDNLRVRLLMQSAVLTFAGYLFVRFDQGHGWGYRYFHSAWGAVPILAGCAMTDRSEPSRRLVSFAGAAAVLNLLFVIPFQMLQIDEIISQHLAQLPPPIRPGNNVYFIHPRGGFYVADMVQIDPLQRARDLYLVSRGTDLDAELVRQNWPSAVKVASRPAADQWYLGPRDRRLSTFGGKRQASVMFAPDAFARPSD